MGANHARRRICPRAAALAVRRALGTCCRIVCHAVTLTSTVRRRPRPGSERRHIGDPQRRLGRRHLNPHDPSASTEIRPAAAAATIAA
jgi:hypothetical protein